MDGYDEDPRLCTAGNKWINVSENGESIYQSPLISRNKQFESQC